MGMNIVVGVFPELFSDADDADRDEQRKQFDMVNRALLAAGLPEHNEPEVPQGGGPRDYRVGSWECVHYLRRIAAYVALRGSLPVPIGELPQHDEVVDTYFRTCQTRPAMDLAGNNAGIQTEVPKSQPPHNRIEVIEGPGFVQLMWHSDCVGYYLPIPFQPVIVVPEDLQWDPNDPWLGSSYTLLQECERLADALQYPRQMSIESMRQHEPDPAADDWRRYAIESFMCQVLTEACHVSIESGCAVVFC